MALFYFPLVFDQGILRCLGQDPFLALSFVFNHHFLGTSDPQTVSFSSRMCLSLAQYSCFSFPFLSRKGGGEGQRIEYPCFGHNSVGVPWKNFQSSFYGCYLLLYLHQLFELCVIFKSLGTKASLQHLVSSFPYSAKDMGFPSLFSKNWFPFLSFALIPLPSSYSVTLHFVRPGREMTLKVKFFPKFSFN